MSVVLFEAGDRVPALELVRAKDVVAGDTVWGWQWMDNLRKGFILETEGVKCENGPQRYVDRGALSYEDKRKVLINSMPINEDYFVLIAVREQ